MNRILLVILSLVAGIDDNVKQEYCVTKNNVQFKIKLNNYTVSSKDTLNVEIEVTNESDNSIYVVPTFHFTYIMDSLTNIPNAIYLDYGSDINKNISIVPFQEIKPKEVKSISRKFICDNFRYNKFSNEIYFSLWLGYVCPERTIKNYTIKDNYIYLSDLYVNEIKTFLVGSIKIIFKN